MFKTLIPFILVIALAVTLLNGNAFGSPTLMSLFFFSLFTCISGILLFITIAFRRRSKLLPISPPIYCFLALALYVLIDGLTHELNLTHLLWIVYAVWLILVFIWASVVNPVKKSPPAFFFYRAISLLALGECIIVLLQAARLFPVPSQWFMSTGTWINPNVIAMFLAMSFFAVFQLKGAAPVTVQRYVYLPLLFLMLLSLAILQCRSAWLATLVIWLGEYRQLWWAFVKKNAKFNWRGLILLIVALIFVQALYTLYSTKEVSAQSRARIWKNSLHLIAKEPLKGYGFGMFEKEYNQYSASLRQPVNDHVNMAYNDFLELGVEGGIPAILLYMAFLLLLLNACWKRKDSRLFIPVIISFVIIQMTNFGYQAIPAMALILAYAALALAPAWEAKPVTYPAAKNKKPAKIAVPVLQPVYTNWYWRGLVGIAGLLPVFLLFLQTSLTMTGFYNKTIIGRSDLDPEAKMEQLKRYYLHLHAYPSYYETYGDLQMSRQEPEFALGFYRMASQRSSDPELLGKMGYCYQLLSGYDSSQYYYELARNMQPHRFTPRLRLLQLYTEKRDTAAMLQTANGILQMPVKVRSKRVSEIQAVARSVIGIYDQSSAHAPF